MRYWSIDAWRGAAVVAMLLFHFIYDLREFYTVSLNYQTGPWHWLGRWSAASFILTAGACTRRDFSSRRHGLQVLLWGGIITAMTAILIPHEYIRFGILHFLGISLLTASALQRLSLGQLAGLGASALTIGLYPDWSSSNQFWQLPGVFPIPITTADYYPFFPWYALFISGVALGRLLFPRLTATPPPPFFRPLCYLGRHSLFLYLIHQPLLLAPYFLL